MIPKGSTCRAGRLAALLAVLLAVQATAHEPVAVPSFATEATAITVDVLVLDKDGRPIRDLKREDFTILEDGRPETIVGFEARDLMAASLTPAAPSGPVATNQGASDQPGRVLAFVLDDLGLDPIRGGADAQKAIARWLEEKADPRDDVTIVTTSGDVWWNDNVSRGKADLLAVLLRVRGKKFPNETREYISDWEASEIGSGAGLGGASSHTGALGASRGTSAAGPAGPGPPQSTQVDLGGVLGRVVKRWSQPTGSCAGMRAEMCEMLVQRRAEEVQDRTLRRRRALLRLVDRLSQALADRHGRKSIVLFSESFIELPQVAPDEKALDAARRANVAVYFVDARGLTALPFFNAENGAAPDGGDVGLMTLDLGSLSVAGGEELAQATGGFAVQSNDLLDGLARAADESSAYYLLGYQPEEKPDGKWHDVKVAVNRPGVKVRARRGYFATPPPHPAAATSNASAPSQSSKALVDPVLVAGGDRNGVPLRLVCRPVGPGEGEMRVLVGLDIGTPGLSFIGGAATIDVALMSVHRERPQPLSFEQRVTLRGDSASGSPWWAFTHELVLAPGSVQVKALVRDTVSGRTGTVTQRIDVPAQLDDPPRAFEQQVAAFHFEPRQGKRNTAVLVQVPAIPTESAENATKRGRMALALRIDDSTGRTAERLTHEWSAEERGSALRFRGSFALAPGDYALESAVLDLATGALSIDRSSLRVPATTGVALSSAMVLGSGTRVADNNNAADDPLRVGDVAFLPLFSPRVTQGTSELPLFFRVYPSGEQPVALSLEVDREGTRIVELEPNPPTPDEARGLAWLGSLRIAELRPGKYDVVVRARQGEGTADETMAFEVTADAPTGKPTSQGDSKAPTGETALARTLRKAGQYVTEYAQAFQNLVADELYEQKTAVCVPGAASRTTRADIVFVALGGPFAWGSFRDVYEVDGQAVRDRQSRLEKVFLQKRASALAQAQAIRTESSRYNVGLARTVNEPTLPLAFLQPKNQHLFEFQQGPPRPLPERAGLEVVFREKSFPTMVRNESGGSLPARGSFWIDPERGVVLQCDVTFRTPEGSVARIEVDYRTEAGLDIWVPAEMRESYGRRGVCPDAVQARARYSGYRRFSVDTTEALRGSK